MVLNVSEFKEDTNTVHMFCVSLTKCAAKLESAEIITRLLHLVISALHPH